MLCGPGNGTRYEDRLRRVVDYIHDHLDGELDMATLAGVAAMSPYHWHRIYSARYGETVFETVKRLRLQRAAADLAHGEMPIAKVATRAGYSAQPSFARAFKSVFGKPPALYRRAGSHTRFDPNSPEGKAIMYDVEIRTLPDLNVVAVPHEGDYMQIGRAFGTLSGVLAGRGLMKPDMAMIAIYLSDPDTVPVAKLQSLAGVTTDSADSAEPPLVGTEIRGGRYAVLRHKGPYADMRAAYRWLLGTWLVQSGEEAADAPLFEIYLNTPGDTPPLELRTDIHLPLEGPSS